MDNFKEGSKYNTRKANISDAASDLLNEGKKLASDIYEDGMDKMSEAQRTAKEYSDELLVSVQKNPLTSVLIAAGVGFILSSLLRK